MGFLEWVIPQDKVFYDLLEKQVALSLEAVQQFRHLLGAWDQLPAERDKMKVIEDRADKVAHDLFDRLTQTFVTPIDREDLARLAHVLDDVVDAVDAAANRLVLYEVDAPTPAMMQCIGYLEEQVKHIETCIVALRRMKQFPTVVPPHLVEIHRLENEADHLLNDAVAGLFKTHDAVQILKYKEVYELLEAATDRCEDVADVLSDVVRKNS